jgi:lysophospholipase L1-like esterase
MRPYQILIFLAAVMAILGGLYWSFQEEDHVDPLTTLESLETLTTLETLDTIPADTIVPEEPKPQPVAVVIPKVAVDSTTDSRVFLSAFYASLAESDERAVRVLHYGDSQIEEDRMSQQIREALQNKYGGSGAGLMPLAQTIPSRTVRQQLYMNDRFTMPSQGPRRYLVYGPKRDQREDGLYGVMGQVAVMNDSLVRGSEEVMAVCTPLDGRKRYTRWQLFADESISDSIAGDTIWLRGKGKVYGLSQESETGIIVDNIPMRGCLGTVFTKMDSAQLATFYREQNVRLIIMQFGGNAIPSNKNPGTIQGIVKGLRQQVQLMRTLAPKASILFIGPSDMLTQTDGEWTTYPMVPYMDRLLRKMALEENIAYFSLYRWMGGAGSMVHWQEIGLAGTDGVHFTRAGARKAGNAVANWILEGNDGMME